MIMETGESFSFSKKETADKANEKVQEWGAINVEMSGSPAMGKARQKVDFNGKYF